MASVSLHVPVAIILLAGGFVSCFFGYRLLRVLLAVYGFIGGIVLAVQFGGDLELWATVLLTIGAGLAGAALAIVAYLAGVALLGAAAGALAINAFWTSETSEPGLWVLLGVCMAGALAALIVRRYVIIIGTSFTGSWAALVGGLALAGNSAAAAVTNGDVRQMYPLAPVDMQLGFAVAWFVLAAVALVVQFRSRHKRI